MNKEEETLVKSVESSGHVAGLSVLTATLFIVGDLAGVGILTLPKALDNTGWIGVVVIAFICFAAYISSAALARSWLIIQERYPEELQNKIVRKPYSKIVEKAFGKWMNFLVSFSINFGMFGTSCVLLIAASQNTEWLLKRNGLHFSFCYFMVVYATILIPVLWLGSPKDFWPIAAVAASTSVTAGIVILIQTFGEYASNDSVVNRSIPSGRSLFLGLSAVSFAIGGVAVFPSVQKDMKEPSKFERALIFGFIVLLVLYLSVAVAGYLALGDEAGSNIVKNLPDGGVKIAVEVLVIVHCMSANVIFLNPIAQNLEDLFSIYPGFSWRRCLIRTMLVLSLLFVCASFPNVGGLVDLIGGSVYSFLTFVAPCMIYLRLTSQKGDWPDRSITLHMKVVYAEIIVVGLLGGVFATYSTLIAITNQSLFTAPCYVEMF